MAWTRRHVVAVGTGVTVTALVGCLGEDRGNSDEGADDTDESDESDDDASTDSDGHERNADAVLEDRDLEDYTDEGAVDVTVDPDDEGVKPAAFEIESDTPVDWVWEGTSTVVYPIDVPEECIWDEAVDEGTVEERTAGEAFDRLFWAEGAYLYGSRDADGEEFTGVFRVREGDDGDE
ncbi:hypothetical protein RBH26_11280 [Natronolimnohabitans sp. A-GB9]|uniref:hypothetical protein n=1 Tax=Natronolimnohabitans sp. A-GB9 TaxID=3069757 RepID=UPI0027B2FEBF|nr:hypothetical protein [Natronolimnohabitans sp. A-GB9]MDQ2051062.1 hypothetical protein [Natronolimnohabitans sp. A-GB9]